MYAQYEELRMVVDHLKRASSSIEEVLSKDMYDEEITRSLENMMWDLELIWRKSDKTVKDYYEGRLVQ